jgi:hypothetical protein
MISKKFNLYFFDDIPAEGSLACRSFLAKEALPLPCSGSDFQSLLSTPFHSEGISIYPDKPDKPEKQERPDKPEKPKRRSKRS